MIAQRLDDVPAGFSAAGRTKPWGTGQAVLTVRDVVRTPFAVMNADDFYGAEAYRLGAAAADLAARRGAASVIAMRLDRTLSPYGPVKRGWCQARDGRVTRLEEVMGIARSGDDGLVASGRHASTRFDGSELVSMNFWVFPPSLFVAVGSQVPDVSPRERRVGSDAEFLLPEVINELIAEGKLDVRAQEAPGPWFGLTYQEDKAEVMSGLVDLTARGVYPRSLAGGDDLDRRPDSAARACWSRRSASARGRSAVSGGAVDDEESMRALHAAIDAGVNFIDTADVYGDGRSERLVARLRRERPRDTIHVATKAGRKLPVQTADGYIARESERWIDASLQNLRTDAIDLLQLHCPHPDVYDRPEVFGVLDDLVAAGKLRHYGVSVETVDEARRAMRYPNVQSIQIIFNMFRIKPAEDAFCRRRRRRRRDHRACAARQRAPDGASPAIVVVRRR